MTTVVLPAERDRTAYLEGLLPPHVIERDAETGGLLRALLEAVAGELAVVEDDVQRLYDSWFVETCPEWVVPYLADLVGLVGLPGDLGAGTGGGVSRRAVVANTVAYRQRKGTVAVIEQVVRDVTGWPTRAVEEYRLLAATTHVNHVHLERPALGSVRGAASAELESPRLAAGALTRFAHTGEVRRIDPGATGRPRALRHRAASPSSSSRCRSTTRPGCPRAGSPTRGACTRSAAEAPLFAVPTTEEAIEHLAAESDLPVPLRPRRLLAALVAARAGARRRDAAGRGERRGRRPARARADPGVRPRGPRRRAAASPLSGWQVMVDAVRGLLHPLPRRGARRPGRPAPRPRLRRRRRRGRRHLRPHASATTPRSPQTPSPATSTASTRGRGGARPRRRAGARAQRSRGPGRRGEHHRRARRGRGRVGRRRPAARRCHPGRVGGRQRDVCRRPHRRGARREPPRARRRALAGAAARERRRRGAGARRLRPRGAATARRWATCTSPASAEPACCSTASSSRATSSSSPGSLGSLTLSQCTVAGQRAGAVGERTAANRELDRRDPPQPGRRRSTSPRPCPRSSSSTASSTPP